MADDPTQPSRQLAEAASSPSAGAPPVPHGTPAAPPATAPSLDSLLTEFEASTAAPKAPEPPQAEVKTQVATPSPAFDPVATAMAGFNDWQRANNLESQLKAATGELQAARNRIDQDDFSRIVSSAEATLKDAELYVPAEFVRGQLIAMATLHPELAAAFDNRHQNPKLFERMLKKATHRIFDAANAMPDREVTADRMAVANYMRGTTKLPAEQPPNYGDMNDADFAKEKAKFGL